MQFFRYRLYDYIIPLAIPSLFKQEYIQESEQSKVTANYQ